jgi:hypothetical protein
MGRALRAEVERAGGIASEPGSPGEVDVLVLTDPNAPLDAAVEAFIEETRDRQLPPEVWALRAVAEDPIARHYLSDPRVAFRALLAPAAEAADVPARAARRALFWIRRDAHFLALGEVLGWSALRRFRRTEPSRPRGAVRVRRRMELLTE